MNSGWQYMIGLLAIILIIGIVLRYGASSHLLAGDLNSFLGIISLQNVGYPGTLTVTGGSSSNTPGPTVPSSRVNQSPAGSPTYA